MKTFRTGQDAALAGTIGEDLACRYLSERGFRVISRNFFKKWGEIDVIAQKGSILSFVEVKAVTCEISDTNPQTVSYVTGKYHPEERVHPEKARRLFRTIQSYLAEREQQDIEWQLAIVAVFLDRVTKRACIRMLENVVVE